MTFLLARNRLESFIRSRSEWCISRQRVWGVPIPALHRISTDEPLLDTASLEYIIGVLSKKGTGYWWSGPIEEFVLPSLREGDAPVNEVWRKGSDTMDVWFDSGTSWSLLDEMDAGDSHSGRPFRADVCIEGSDQHRGWFQSQLLTAVSATPQQASPYGTLITHGMVLDQHGRKMSKSLGNVISHMTIIHGGKVC
jgi:isoleucyl-tRNA synthetase